MDIGYGYCVIVTNILCLFNVCIKVLTLQPSFILYRDGVTEENVRRYLLRKPMSSKDLSKIFKSKKLGLSNEEIVVKLTEIIKRIRPITQKVNHVTYFSLKQ